MHNGICGSFLPKYERQIRLLLIHAQQQREVRGEELKGPGDKLDRVVESLQASRS